VIKIFSSRYVTVKVTLLGKHCEVIDYSAQLGCQQTIIIFFSRDSQRLSLFKRLDNRYSRTVVRCKSY